VILQLGHRIRAVERETGVPPREVALEEDRDELARLRLQERTQAAKKLIAWMQGPVRVRPAKECPGRIDRAALADVIVPGVEQETADRVRELRGRPSIRLKASVNLAALEGAPYAEAVRALDVAPG